MRKLSRHGVLATSLVWLPLTALVAALFVAPSSNGSSAAGGSLNVTPNARTYGGQKLVFSGDMGAGQQRIFLQRRGCTSCIWSEVVDPRTGKPFTMLTDGDGSFRFDFPAPAMDNVFFRVHSRQADTGAHQFDTVHQEAEIFLVDLGGGDYQLKVDTVRVNSGAKRPVLKGRGVELQQRDEGTLDWKLKAVGSLNSDGLAFFSSTDAPDNGVYRVVLDDWRQGGDAVGWFPSLPFYLDVSRPRLVRATEAQAEPAWSTALADDGTTAAQRYGWRTMQWDFAWEFGESLSSGAYRGEKWRGGSWAETTSGTGRVVKWGGGIEFHSGDIIRNTVTPDRGTTTLTLAGKPARLGRWELRERIRLYNQAQFGDAPGGPPYAFVVELIPADPAQYDCGRHNITIARAPVGGPTIQIGANAGTSRWTKTLTGFGRPGDGKVARLYGVQITGRKLTWYVNGRAVASLAAAAAIPKVPMTVRMRMVGAGAKDMRKSQVLIDWVRNYDLDKGSTPRRLPGLRKGTFGGDC